MNTYTLIVGDENGLRGEAAVITDRLTPQTLRQHREDLGLSRSKLALLAGCSAVHIAKLEYGENRMTVNSHAKLTRALREYRESMDL